VTHGIVGGFDKTGNLKTDAEINPENSGGAALDDLDLFLGVPSFISEDALGKIRFIISINRIKEWLGSFLKSGLPQTTEQMASAFEGSNLNFSGDNIDQSNNYPRILSKFAAVEMLLSLRANMKRLCHKSTSF
jgi:S1-C subfamily serine protease